MTERKNILWLASWYPSEAAPFNGDFVQRHANAASLFNNIYVLYVVKDSAGVITKNITKKLAKEGRCTETILYYYSPQTGLLGRLLSQWKYSRFFKQLVKEHIAEYGKPQAVHVHVGMKAGMIARWIKKRYNIPYFLTEHWSGLLPEATPALKDYPLYYQKTYGQIIKNAVAISAVSKHLSQQIRKSFGVAPVVIPNVVNTTLFKPGIKQPASCTKFIHISGLTFEKNGKAILQAFKIVKEKGYLFHLDIIGSLDAALIQETAFFGLNQSIQFHPEMPQQQLVPFLQQAAALIIYSRFETFGCVVIEAHACGVPVIASNIPALQELVEEGKNGFLVPVDNSVALAEMLIKFINNQEMFNRQATADSVSKYSYETVGKTISDWYMKNGVV